jgi:hypothetical protein
MPGQEAAVAKRVRHSAGLDLRLPPAQCAHRVLHLQMHGLVI